MASAMGSASRDQYDSKALVKASIPVTAARVLGMLVASSGSTMATVGNMNGLPSPIERLASMSHRAEPEVTSLLLPDVVGTAMKGSPARSMLLRRSAYSAHVPSWAARTATALARSMALPPPTATTMSQEAARHRSSAVSTSSGGGNGVARSKRVTRDSPRASSTLCRIPRDRRLWRPVTRNMRADVPATASTSSRRLASSPTPNRTFVGLLQRKDGIVCSTTADSSVTEWRHSITEPRGSASAGSPGCRVDDTQGLTAGLRSLDTGGTARRIGPPQSAQEGDTWPRSAGPSL